MRLNARNCGRFLLFVGVLLLAACATGPNIRTDQDPQADFNRYRTWAFYTPIAMESSGYSTWITTRIKDNVRREMEARGYRYDESSPDLRVNFQGILQDKLDVYSMPRMGYDYFYGYRHAYFAPSPFWDNDTVVRQYTEGTLTVDVVDAQHKRLLWTGAAIGRVSNKQTQPQKMAEIDAAISGIFAQYPHRAGAAAAATLQ